MPVNVLVGFDGSPLSERALTYAIETFPEAAVTAIYVIDPFDSVIDVEAGGLPVAEDWYENATAEAAAIHTAATEAATGLGAELATVTEVGKPARAILNYAADHGVDQIVVGSHGRKGIGRALLGSVAERVARRARIPVTIVS